MVHVHPLPEFLFNIFTIFTQDTLASLYSEITSLAWLENRILCSGWNNQVTEFATCDINIYKKSWGVRHTDYILCSAAWFPQVLATATYNGEIILWRLETGQPFRKYKVDDPTSR